MATSPEDLSKQQWDFLVSLFNAEKATNGRLNACSWTDAAGNAKSSSIIDVRRNVEYWFTSPLDPNTVDVSTCAALGVQLLSWEVQPYASSRWKLVTTFQVSIASTSANRTVSGGELLANGDDALAQAWAFVTDGTGKGLSLILRDSANWTMGGNAELMVPSSGRSRLDIGAGDTPQVWAFVDLMVRAEKLLSISA